jgi:acyl-homoserine-lactone acylase
VRKSLLAIIPAAVLLVGVGASRAQSQVSREEWGAVAASVEIIRDTYGVPHIYGPTDASVVFGAAYAQAEDNWWQVEDNFVRSIGRGAELYGESALVDDYLVRAMEIAALSREEYRASTPQMRAMYDAYAAGFNHYLRTHPETGVRLLTEIEPWYTLAMIRFKYHHNEYLSYARLNSEDTAMLMAAPGVVVAKTSGPGFEDGGAALAFQREISPNGERALGSNQVALSGTHTGTGSPMLLINPHVSFFGLSQYWEVHLVSEEGLEFSGQGRFGFMLPYMGHSTFLGWGYTDNYSDIGDLYWEHFDNEDAPLEYRYETDRRVATEWTEDIGVLSSDGRVEQVTATFRKTHHGPIVGLRAGSDGVVRPLAARLAKLEEGGWFAQWHAQMMARSLPDWKRAASVLSVAYQNTMYADRDGNILYLYNAAVPRRNATFNWLEPVDGSDPATEWDGYHSLEELPQFLNPESSWLQNTNSDPMRASDGLNRTRADFPSYMVGPEPHNARAVSATRIMRELADPGGRTLMDFAQAVLDTRMSAADREIPPLLDEFAELQASGAARADRLIEPIAVITNWNHEAETASVATTLFVGWAQARQASRGGDPVGEQSSGTDAYPRIAALERAIHDLEQAWGTWRKPWGEVNRAQRPDASGTLPFDDALPSVAVPAAPGWLGSFFTYHTRTAPGGHIGYGVHGNSFVKVISFGEVIEARSILTFGASGNPASSHYFDQAPLYGQKMFKPAWFSRGAVEANAERIYRLREIN